AEHALVEAARAAHVVGVEGEHGRCWRTRYESPLRAACAKLSPHVAIPPIGRASGAPPSRGGERSTIVKRSLLRRGGRVPDIIPDFAINAPPARVFPVISTADGLASWWTKTSSGDARNGAQLVLGFGPEYDWRAEVTRFQPDAEYELQLTS